MGCCCSKCGDSHDEDANLVRPAARTSRSKSSVISGQPRNGTVPKSDLEDEDALLGQRLWGFRDSLKGEDREKMMRPRNRIFRWGEIPLVELELVELLDTDNSYVKDPTLLLFEFPSSVRSIACGESHTMYVLMDGTVWTSGSNDHGQLGHSEPGILPARVDKLNSHQIVAVSAGYAHSLALTYSGIVFAWGSDAHGQLGLGSQNSQIVSVPRVIMKFGRKVVIQIAAGHSHSVFLTADGELYTCGSNKNGQLGYASSTTSQKIPTLVTLLVGFPAAFVTAGDFHTFAVSVTGSVFGWGKNSSGQLGVGDTEDKLEPLHLITLQSHGVCFIAAGSNHTAFLTQDGGVFTCGDGKSGQLGHPSFSNERLPRKILEFGSTIVQVACGLGTTICTTDNGKIYACGQREPPDKGKTNSPLLIGGIADPVQSIFAGCCQNFTVVSDKIGTPPLDYRKHDGDTQIIALSQQRVHTICSVVEPSKVYPIVEAIFGSVSVYNASFVLTPDRRIKIGGQEKTVGFDLEEAETVLSKLHQIKSPLVADMIDTVILKNLVPKVQWIHQMRHEEMLRICVIVTLMPAFYSGKSHVLPVKFAEQILEFPAEAGGTVFNWMYRLRIEQLHRLVSVYKKTVLLILEATGYTDISVKGNDLRTCLKFLAKLYELNKAHPAQQRLSFHAFTIPQLSDKIDVPSDYVGWLVHNQGTSFFFCRYPFVFNTHAKSILLEVDQGIQMRMAMDKAASEDVIMSVVTGELPRGPGATMFLNLVVTRENIVEDTILQLVSLPSSILKRPLRVKFLGEEGEDAGGIRKEFFLLLIREILNEKYGMFKYYEESRLIWFNDSTLEDVSMFFLIGILLGLAIYNYTIVNFPFPLALYKKLLGQNVSLEDLKELEPSLAENLEKLLHYSEPDFEEVFGLNFDCTLDNFGIITSVPLKSGGSDIPVTLENRKEYVELYVDHKLNVATQRQFEAFLDGFGQVCGSKVLSLFYPEQLQEMVIGNEDYDWGELEENCTYSGGFNEFTPTIKLFWEVFHEFSLDDKKQFLLFLTGSDRIPILGMKALKMVIQEVEGNDYLPVAHTCFNQLDLPPYRSKEIILSKMKQAIENNVGFSLV